MCYLFHDSYYKDISHKTFEERAQTNFDHPDSLETDLLLKHIQDLKAGRGCQVPTYDFATHSRTDICVDMQPRSIIIVEGILLFTNPHLTAEMDVKVFVVRIWRTVSNETFGQTLMQHFAFDPTGCRCGCSADATDSSRYKRTRENSGRSNRTIPCNGQTDARRMGSKWARQFQDTVASFIYYVSHDSWTLLQEPSKKVADIVVHSTGDSLNVAIEVLKNHVRAVVKEE